MISTAYRFVLAATIFINLPLLTNAFASPPHRLINQRQSGTKDVLLMVTTEIDETTSKYGLEAGLLQSLRQDSSGTSAKELLTKYGIAYLATSIPLALVSFTICYALVDNGIDVSGLLSRVGIDANSGSEKVGTFAIAYAAHKAASPIRFPPTVLLTPVMARLIGKDPVEEEQNKEEI